MRIVIWKISSYGSKVNFYNFNREIKDSLVTNPISTIQVLLGFVSKMSIQIIVSKKSHLITLKLTLMISNSTVDKKRLELKICKKFIKV